MATIDPKGKTNLKSAEFSAASGYPTEIKLPTKGGYAGSSAQPIRKGTSQKHYNAEGQKNIGRAGNFGTGSL